MNRERCISPIPQRIKYLGGSDIVLGAPGKAFCHIETAVECPDGLVQSAGRLLKRCDYQPLKGCS